MIIPREMISMPTPEAFKSFKQQQIVLQPANNTGNQAFTASQNGRILFNLPAYNAAFLNSSRSFFSFRARAEATSFANTDVLKFVDGIPVIDRMTIRANGLMLEDIQGYAEIERALANLGEYTKAYANMYQTGDYRPLLEDKVSGGTNLTTIQANISKSHTGTSASAKPVDTQGGKVFRKHFGPSGIMGTDKMLPIGLLAASGGYALQIELYLQNDAAKVLEHKNATTDVSAYTGLTYHLYDVQLNLTLLEMPPDVFADFNQDLLNGGKFVLDFSHYRLHKHHLPSGAQSFNITIHEASKNIDKVITIFRENTTDGYRTLKFKGGANSSAALKRFQYKYGTAYMPNSPLEANLDGESKDSLLFLCHAMTGLDILETVNQPVASLLDNQGNPKWDSASHGYFMLVQSFKTTKDPVLNGLNSLNSAAPLQIDLTWNGALTTALSMDSYVAEHERLVITTGGKIYLE